MSPEMRASGAQKDDKRLSCPHKYSLSPMGDKVKTLISLQKLYTSWIVFRLP